MICEIHHKEFLSLYDVWQYMYKKLNVHVLNIIGAFLVKSLFSKKEDEIRQV